MAGLAAARARGRKGGRKFALTKAQVRLAQAAMANRDTSVATLAAELGVKPVTLYRYVDASRNFAITESARCRLSVLSCTLRHQTPSSAIRSAAPGRRPRA